MVVTVIIRNCDCNFVLTSCETDIRENNDSLQQYNYRAFLFSLPVNKFVLKKYIIINYVQVANNWHEKVEPTSKQPLSIKNTTSRTITPKVNGITENWEWLDC